MQKFYKKKIVTAILAVSMLLTTGAFSMTVRASEQYSENILQNPEFSFDSDTNTYPGWQFCSSGNYPEAQLSYAAGVLPQGGEEGWNLVPDSVAGFEHTFVKSDSDGLLIKNTILNRLQYNSRVGQEIDTIPGTVYRVSIPFELVESVGDFEPRYGYAVEDGSFHGQQLSYIPWTFIPGEVNRVLITFTAVSEKAYVRFAFDNNGNNGEAGDYTIIRLHDLVVDAQLMETVVKGVYHKGLADEKELYSHSVFDINNLYNSKSVTADTVKGYKLVEGQTNPQTYIPTEDHIFEFEYESNMSQVQIEAYLTGTTTPVPGFTPYTVEAENGTSFSHDAPAIDGYKNVAPFPEEITVQAGGTNKLIFYYKAVTGSTTPDPDKEDPHTTNPDKNKPPKTDGTTKPDNTQPAKISISAGNTQAPKTGDTSNWGWWVALIVVALGGIAVIVWRRFRR